MTGRLVLVLAFTGAVLVGCGGSDESSTAGTPTGIPPSATAVAKETVGSPTLAPTAAPANVVFTVSRQSIGADSVEKLTLPVMATEDIVGTIGYRPIFDCGYVGFLAKPGATLVSPVDGVVNTKYEVSTKDPLTGNTGGLAIGLTMPSGNTVDMYFGGGSTSDLTVGATVTRGQAIGIHSGKEMNSFSLGFNTIMVRSAKKTCVTSMAKPDEWVGGSPSVLAQ